MIILFVQWGLTVLSSVPVAPTCICRNSSVTEIMVIFIKREKHLQKPGICSVSLPVCVNTLRAVVCTETKIPFSRPHWKHPTTVKDIIQPWNTTDCSMLAVSSRHCCILHFSGKTKFSLNMKEIKSECAAIPTKCLHQISGPLSIIWEETGIQQVDIACRWRPSWHLTSNNGSIPQTTEMIGCMAACDGLLLARYTEWIQVSTKIVINSNIMAHIC